MKLPQDTCTSLARFALVLLSGASEYSCGHSVNFHWESDRSPIVFYWPTEYIVPALVLKREIFKYGLQSKVLDCAPFSRMST